MSDIAVLGIDKQDIDDIRAIAMENLDILISSDVYCIQFLENKR